MRWEDGLADDTLLREREREREEMEELAYSKKQGSFMREAMA